MNGTALAQQIPVLRTGCPDRWGRQIPRPRSPNLVRGTKYWLKLSVSTSLRKRLPAKINPRRTPPLAAKSGEEADPRGGEPSTMVTGAVAIADSDRQCWRFVAGPQAQPCPFCTEHAAYPFVFQVIEFGQLGAYTGRSSACLGLVWHREHLWIDTAAPLDWIVYAPRL